MKKMPLKLQNTKSHKKEIFSILFLEKFSVLVAEKNLFKQDSLFIS